MRSKHEPEAAPKLARPHITSSPLRRQQKEQEKLLEQSAGLAGLLLEILPGVDDAALQALAFEAASLYLAN